MPDHGLQMGEAALDLRQHKPLRMVAHIEQFDCI
jgi:hypothetical protein